MKKKRRKKRIEKTKLEKRKQESIQLALLQESRII